MLAGVKKICFSPLLVCFHFNCLFLLILNTTENLFVVQIGTTTTCFCLILVIPSRFLIIMYCFGVVYAYNLYMAVYLLFYCLMSETSRLVLFPVNFSAPLFQKY